MKLRRGGWGFGPLTARLGRVYAQLLRHVVPRWEAEEAVAGRVLAALVEVKPQGGGGGGGGRRWPGFRRLSVGGAVPVHRRWARVRHRVHGWL